MSIHWRGGRTPMPNELLNWFFCCCSKGSVLKICKTKGTDTYTYTCSFFCYRNWMWEGCMITARRNGMESSMAIIYLGCQPDRSFGILKWIVFEFANSCLKWGKMLEIFFTYIIINNSIDECRNGRRFRNDYCTFDSRVFAKYSPNLINVFSQVAPGNFVSSLVS